MRTAHLIGVFPKGSETFILNQLGGLIDRGHEVDIYALYRGDDKQIHPIVERYGLLKRMRYIPRPRNRVQRLAKAASHLARPYAWHSATLDALDARKHGKTALDLEKLYTTLSFLREGKPYDVVHCHFGNLGLVGLNLLEQGLVPGKLVTSIRGADITSTLKAQPHIYDGLVANGHLFLPVSYFFKDKLTMLGCDPAKVTVLRDGIDIGRFAFKERRRTEKEATRLLFVGRLEEKKGIFFAARAVANVLKSGRKLHFDIVGDGELRSQLETFITDQGIARHITLHGFQAQDRVLELLSKAHLLIAPSITSPSGDQEGIPNTVKEGMAAGLPVLSTMHSGIPELVEDGVSGYLVPENDVTALTAQLCLLIDRPDMWAAMGKAGRVKIEKDYDIERLNDELEALYRKPISATAPTKRKDKARSTPSPSVSARLRTLQQEER